MEETKFNNIWAFLKESNYEHISDIGTDMKCAICKRILINAHSSTSCGCSYCLDCVQAYLNGERKLCPGNMDDCQLEPLDIHRNVVPDSKVNYKISKLIVSCRYSCGFRCELRNMEEHERACGRQPANCPYVNVGCTEKQLVSDRINEHMVGESGAHATLLMACIDRLQEEIVAMRLARDSDEARTNEKMDRIEQEVANLRNENRFASQENSSLREEMERHRAKHVAHVAGTEQQLAELRARVETQARDIELLGEKCSHSEEKLGELERQAREEKEELRKNIDLMHEKQVSRNSELEKRVREMGANVVEIHNRGGFVWRIDGWVAKNQLAREGSCTELFSEAFFSHENGYKICLLLYPDGEGDVKGTHLSVFFCLMMSSFDSTLSWPFKRAVTFSIIDQRTGIDQASTTRTYDNHVNWNRPSSERNGGIGCDMIELAALSSTAGLIQDDTILIRCVVKSVPKK